MWFGILVSCFILFVDAQRNDTRALEHDRIECRNPHGNEIDPFEKCSHYFYQCDGDYIGYRTLCQNNLYYDVEWDECLQFVEVPACSDVTHGPFKTTIFPERTTVDQTLFDCTKARSGNYADERGITVNDKRIPFCANRFFVCSNGLLSTDHCPAGYYFDQPINQCGSFDEVFDCNGHIRLTSPPSTIPPPRTTTEDLHFDCSGKVGIYADPLLKCSHRFLYCPDGGYPIKGMCQENLWYNPETFRCEQYELVFACTGVRVSSTLSPLTWSTNKPYYFNCTGLQNGRMYPNPDKACSNIFYECDNGFGWQKMCAPDATDSTYFDVTIQQCNYKKNMPVCGGRPSRRPTENTEEPTTTKFMTELPASTRRRIGRMRTTTSEFLPTELPSTELPSTRHREGRPRSTTVTTDGR